MTEGVPLSVCTGINRVVGCVSVRGKVSNAVTKESSGVTSICKLILNPHLLTFSQHLGSAKGERLGRLQQHSVQ